ncbi:MAG: hypothetical protein ACYTEW_26145, partial [Planctomycetota bacterium]
SRNQAFGYDELNRLESASGIYGQIGYIYDFVGNRKTKTVDGQTDNYAYEPNTNKLDEITGANPMDFGHDPNGNIVTLGSKTFTYNQNNRPIQASELWDPRPSPTTKTTAPSRPQRRGILWPSTSTTASDSASVSSVQGRSRESVITI